MVDVALAGLSTTTYPQYKSMSCRVAVDRKAAGCAGRGATDTTKAPPVSSAACKAPLTTDHCGPLGPRSCIATRA